MADSQIGNAAGVAAVDNGSNLLATVVSDGVNNVVVDDVSKLQLGDIIDIVNISTGAVLASARTIDGIVLSSKTVTYTGADVIATTSHGIYFSGDYGTHRSNRSGGRSADSGYRNRGLTDIQSMRDRLTAINGTYYTAARLNNMTYNDMVYAIRLADDLTTVR